MTRSNRFIAVSESEVVPLFTTIPGALPGNAATAIGLWLDQYNDEAARLISAWSGDRAGVRPALTSTRNVVDALKERVDGSTSRPVSREMRVLLAEIGSACLHATAALNVLDKAVPDVGAGAATADHSPVVVEVEPNEPYPVLVLRDPDRVLTEATRRAVREYSAAAAALGQYGTRAVEETDERHRSAVTNDEVRLLAMAVVRCASAEPRGPETAMLVEAAQDVVDSFADKGKRSVGEPEPAARPPARGETGSDAIRLTITAPGVSAELCYKSRADLVGDFAAVGLDTILTRPGSGLDELVFRYAEEGGEPAPTEVRGRYFRWVVEHSPEAGEFRGRASLIPGSVKRWNEAVLRDVGSGSSCGYFRAGDEVVFFTDLQALDVDLRLLRHVAHAPGDDSLRAIGPDEAVGAVTREHHRGPARDIFRVRPHRASEFPLVRAAIKDKVHPRHRVRLPDGAEQAAGPPGGGARVAPAAPGPTDVERPGAGQPDAIFPMESFLHPEDAYRMVLPDGLRLWPDSGQFVEDFAAYNKTAALLDTDPRLRKFPLSRREHVAITQGDLRLLQRAVPADWPNREPFAEACDRAEAALDELGRQLREEIAKASGDEPAAEPMLNLFFDFADSPGGAPIAAQTMKLAAVEEYFTSAGLGYVFDGCQVGSSLAAVKEDRKHRPTAREIDGVTCHVYFGAETGFYAVRLELPSYAEAAAAGLKSVISAGSGYLMLRKGYVMVSAQEGFAEYGKAVVDVMRVASGRVCEIRAAGGRLLRKRGEFDVRYLSGARSGKLTPQERADLTAFFAARKCKIHKFV